MVTLGMIKKKRKEVLACGILELLAWILFPCIIWIGGRQRCGSYYDSYTQSSYPRYCYIWLGDYPVFFCCLKQYFFRMDWYSYLVCICPCLWHSPNHLHMELR